MGTDTKKISIENFESLSNEQKELVVVFIETLKHAERSLENNNKNGINKRHEILKKMDALAVEISKQWDGEQNAADLVSSMRR